MNKILKYAGIPMTLVLGWAGYLFFYKWQHLGQDINSGEGLLLLALMAVVVVICEAIQPSSR